MSILKNINYKKYLNKMKKMNFWKLLKQKLQLLLIKITKNILIEKY